MLVLVIEDEPDFADALQRMLQQLPGHPEVTVARSRDAAIELLGHSFFDLVILDLKIPTVDGALDADAAYGHVVFGRIREMAPGTPVFVLTGSPAEDFIPQLLQQAQQVDIWGLGQKVGTVDFLKKYKFSECPAKLAPVADAVHSLSQVELDRGGVDLSVEEDRLVRIFARRFGGRRCVLSRLGVGLSGAKVIRLRVTDSGGARVHDAVAKLGSLRDIRDEADRFDNQVARLLPSATPRKLAVLEFGAKATAGIFYGLAEGFDQTAFDVAMLANDLPAKMIQNLQSATQRWWEGVPESRRTIGSIRQRVLSDDGLQEIVRAFPIAWVSEFEQSEIQTRWSCVHGDLHGSNVLVSASGTVALIDYGDVGDGPASLDPITLEFSLVFHPQGPLRRVGWPTVKQAANWGIQEQYLAGCPAAALVSECREWARRVAAGNREIAASAYSYLVRQLKYDDTPKELALSLLEGVRSFFDKT